MLVEKPFVPTRNEADELRRLAEEKKLALHVGHEFLVASYLYYFREEIEKRNPLDDSLGAKKVTAHWLDVPVEPRSGILKKPDVTTSVVSDLFPHVLSQLTVLFGAQPVAIDMVEISDGGWTANIDLQFGDCPVSVSLSRCAEATDRSLKVETANGTFGMNYNSEPAALSIDCHTIEQDPNWDCCLRPLNAEVAHLFLQAGKLDSLAPFIQAVSRNEHIFEATWQAEEEVKRLQKAALRDCILADSCNLGSRETKDALDGLRQHLVPALLDEQLMLSPKDTKTIDDFIVKAFQIIRRMANQPFTTQEQIAQETGLPTADQIRLNSALRKIPFVQDLIMNCGHGSKYLANSIAPIIRSGAIEKALNHKYDYPHRVGVYAGQSCMFFCTFCGRKHGAKYDRDSVHPGNEMLKQIFRNAPKDDPHRFYLSGGLEPLTNMGIGDVIQAGAEEGFLLSLYTNAFMLTPKLVEKQPGLWHLNTLRISFYGVDAETTEAVTQKKKSFDQVVANAKTFLAERNRRESDLKLGFNFVMLPGKTEQILQLAEVLAEINRSDPDGRQIDFLTLREDYSVPSGQGISPDERAKLIATFDEFEARRKKDDLADLHVDFGYSLQALKLGHQGYPLEMVTHEEMRPQAYPQVSVVVDLLGDVYAYREAGFLDRDGAHRYIIERINEEQSFDKIISDFITSGATLEAHENDTDYFDIFDHVVTKLLNQADADRQFGIPFEQGPISSRSLVDVESMNLPQIQNAHFAAANSE